MYRRTISLETSPIVEQKYAPVQSTLFPFVDESGSGNIFSVAVVHVETPSTWGLYVWNSRRGPEPVFAQEGWYIVRTKYGMQVMQPAVFQQLYVQYEK